MAWAPSGLGKVLPGRVPDWLVPAGWGTLQHWCRLLVLVCMAALLSVQCGKAEAVSLGARQSAWNGQCVTACLGSPPVGSYAGWKFLYMAELAASGHLHSSSMRLPASIFIGDGDDWLSGTIFHAPPTMPHTAATQGCRWSSGQSLLARGAQHSSQPWNAYFLCCPPCLWLLPKCQATLSGGGRRCRSIKLPVWGER